jgi:hypothetical protein
MLWYSISVLRTWGSHRVFYGHIRYRMSGYCVYACRNSHILF